MTLLAETKANFEGFYSSWTAEAKKNWEALHAEDKLLASYRRVSALQGFKVDLLASRYGERGMSFFNEAHNDALVSHVSASLGAWRLSMQSLRSLLENTLCGIYYAEHPIELRNWERGKKKVGFSELISYFEAHPDLEDLDDQACGLDRIKEEYKTLSVAVHSSAKSFRMTDDVGQILLWNNDKARLGKWSTRELASLSGLLLLLMALNRQALAGTKLINTRTALGFIFGKTLRTKIKSTLGITIHEPE